MYIRVRATPNAKKEKIERTNKNEFDIAVKEPAERNMANTRIREIVANECRVSVKNVRIVTGHRSHTKMLSVEV
jgi:uncharacterized protein YggU (UPF0235/DUF167 family)